ncbi:hypothetical protein D3C81_1960020 [compost metagenome]
MGRIGAQVSPWRVYGESGIRAQGDQRGFANPHLRQGDVVFALADVQQHFHAQVSRCDMGATRLREVGAIGALVAGDLPYGIAQLDLVALGAGIH